MLRAPSTDLIDLIYDAAVEPQLWDRVLIDIADMLSSTGGAPCGYADRNLQAALHYFGRIDYEFAARHGFPIMSENPWPPVVLGQPVGHVVTSDAIMPLADHGAHRWYRECITPPDTKHALLMHLYAETASIGALRCSEAYVRGAT
jgi:hypothetical protein